MTISGTDGTIKVDGIISRMEEATAALRFVERLVQVDEWPALPRKLHILQQQWQITERTDGVVTLFDLEWRDVPLELEE